MVEVDYPYPNTLLRQTIKGVETVLGRKGLEASLHAADLGRYLDALPADDLGQEVTAQQVARLFAAVDALTGRAARTTLQRIGRHSFQWALEEIPGSDWAVVLALRTRPAAARQMTILRALAAGRCDLIPEIDVDVTRENGVLVWRDYCCAECLGRQGEDVLCHCFGGYLQAALAFGTGRAANDFVIVESACRARGDECCRYEIKESSHDFKNPPE